MTAKAYKTCPGCNKLWPMEIFTTHTTTEGGIQTVYAEINDVEYQLHAAECESQ